MSAWNVHASNPLKGGTLWTLWASETKEKNVTELKVKGYANRGPRLAVPVYQRGRHTDNTLILKRINGTAESRNPHSHLCVHVLADMQIALELVNSVVLFCCRLCMPEMLRSRTFLVSSCCCVPPSTPYAPNMPP